MIASAWVQRPSDADFAELRHARLNALLERAAGLPRGAAKQFSPADRANLKEALVEAFERAASILPITGQLVRVVHVRRPTLDERAQLEKTPFSLARAGLRSRWRRNSPSPIARTFALHGRGFRADPALSSISMRVRR